MWDLGWKSTQVKAQGPLYLGKCDGHVLDGWMEDLQYAGVRGWKAAQRFWPQPLAKVKVLEGEETWGNLPYGSAKEQDSRVHPELVTRH